MGARPSTIIRRYLFGNVDPERAGDRDAQRRRRDPDAGRPRLPRPGHPAQQAAEWGYDLQRAVADAGAGIWWTALYPGLGIVIAVTALTLVGEGLNDVLNPTLRRRRVTTPVVHDQRRADRVLGGRPGVGT